MVQDWCTSYILDEQGNPIPEHDPMKWSRWFHEADRQIGDTSLGDIRVSTVFLGLPHPSANNDEMMLFETMVFADDAILKRISQLSETDDRSIITHFLNALGGSEYWDLQKRYATREEALKGHQEMCVFIETCIAKGLLGMSEE